MTRRANQIANQVLEGSVMIVVAVVLLIALFAAAFTLEESYANWPQRPGRRVMPAVAVYATYGVAATAVAAAFITRLQRFATVLAAVNMLGLWLLFYLIVSDILISRAP